MRILSRLVVALLACFAWNCYAATADSFEPDNATDPSLTQLSATTLSRAKPIISGVTQTHSLHTGGTLSTADRDVVKFTLSVTSDVIVQTDLDVGPADTVLRLFDSGGFELLEDDESNPAGNNLSRLTLTDMAPGTYYVSVEEYSIASGTARVIESYKLSMVSAAAGTKFPPVFTNSSASVNGAVGGKFNYLISAIGSNPITFSASGLPDGLKVSGQSIVGVPTKAGSFNVSLTASNGTAPDAKTTISIVVTESEVIDSIAGDGKARAGGDGGPGSLASLNAALGVGIDSNGNVLIADTNNNLIRRVDNATGEIATIAGTGFAGNTGNNGLAVNARLDNPRGVCADAAGNVYISDANNSSIRKISPSGIITLLNGTLNYPHGLCVDPNGNVYVADAGDGLIYRISPAGVRSTFAGGLGEFTTPTDCCLDSAGNVYVADSGNSRIYKVSPAGVVTPFAGTGALGFSGDGSAATAALLNSPQGVALDAAGNVYISDSGNNRIRKVSGGTISTVAGGGAFDFSLGDLGAHSTDGAAALNCVLAYPYHVRVDSAGAVYVADMSANLVRKIARASKPVITSALTLNAPKGAPLSPAYKITYTGHPLPVFTTSLLPTGLSQSNNSISGIPTQSGAADVTMTATNAIGSDSKILHVVLGGAGGALSTSGNTGTEIAATPNPAALKAASAGQTPIATVTFVAPTITHAADLVSYMWDFGDANDSTPASGEVASHNFTKVGLYTVTLTVTDGTNTLKKTATIGVNSPDVTEAIIITKVQLKFDFSGTTSKDSLSIGGIAPFRQKASIAGSEVIISVGPLRRTFTLDARGSASNGKTDILKFSAKTTGGTIDAANNFVSGKFQRSIRGEALASAFAALGFVKGVAKPVPIKLPVLVSINGDSYADIVTIVFKSNDKTGSGTKQKEGGTLPTR